MDTTPNILELFINFLSKRGFPNASIIPNDPIAMTEEGEHVQQPTFSIIEPETEEYLAMIELREEIGPGGLTEAADMLNTYLHAVDDLLVESYLVILNSKAAAGRKILFFKLVNNDYLELIPPNDFPDYAALLNSYAAMEEEVDVVEERQVVHREAPVQQPVSPPPPSRPAPQRTAPARPERSEPVQPSVRQDPALVKRQRERIEALHRYGTIAAMLCLLLLLADSVLVSIGINLLDVSRTLLVVAGLAFWLLPYAARETG